MSISQLSSSDAIVDPEDWVDVYGDTLYRFALSRLRDANAAEEVVQETFLAGIRNQSQFSGRGSQGAWLVGIMRRKILDYVKLRARHQQQVSDEDFDPTSVLFDESGHWRQGVLPTTAPEEHLESRELWAVVQSCLSQLPPGQADVFVLSVMEEMDTENICKELGISPSNMWVRLHRARLGLAKCVAAKWFDAQKSESHG